jgi:hypothetical protein
MASESTQKFEIAASPHTQSSIAGRVQRLRFHFSQNEGLKFGKSDRWVDVEVDMEFKEIFSPVNSCTDSANTDSDEL